MYLLIQAYPERAISFVVTDNFGTDKDMKEIERKSIMFTNFTYEVDKMICEHHITNVVLYGPFDYIKKLADFLKEDFPMVRVKMVPAHR